MAAHLFRHLYPVFSPPQNVIYMAHLNIARLGKWKMHDAMKLALLFMAGIGIKAICRYLFRLVLNQCGELLVHENG